MKMRRLQNLLLIICIALSCATGAAGLIHAAGYVGAEVKVSCPYEEGYDSYEKYLCRNDCGNDDDVVIKTTEVSRDRYAISDDTQKHVFTVTISNLNHMDAGKYWCMVTKVGVDPSSDEVKVEVVPDTCCDGSTKVQSFETGSASFTCPYESKDRTNMKYICRGNQPSTCLQQAAITSDSKRNRQFRLNDDTVSRKFTVTITGLTQRDSGSYLCGVHRNSGLDVFTAIELEVKVFPKTTSYVTPLITVGPVESQTMTQIPGKPITAAPSSCLLLTVLATLAVLLSLTFALIMVYKYYKLKGAGLNMSRYVWKTGEGEEMVAVVDVYENETYSDLGSYRQQRTLQCDCNASEDQQESVLQIDTLTGVYSVGNKARNN